MVYQDPERPEPGVQGPGDHPNNRRVPLRSARRVRGKWVLNEDAADRAAKALIRKREAQRERNKQRREATMKLLREQKPELFTTRTLTLEHWRA